MTGEVDQVKTARPEAIDQAGVRGGVQDLAVQTRDLPGPGREPVPFRPGRVQRRVAVDLGGLDAQEAPHPDRRGRRRRAGEPAGHGKAHAQEVVVVEFVGAHQLPGDPWLVGEDHQGSDAIAPSAGATGRRPPRGGSRDHFAQQCMEKSQRAAGERIETLATRPAR